MAFPYTFPFFFSGVTFIAAADAAAGRDGVKLLNRWGGTELKLRGQPGQIALPHKEVSL